VTTEGYRVYEDDPRLYLDDLQVGQRFNSGTYVIEETQIKAFAAPFDPQPFHLDESAGQASRSPGRSKTGLAARRAAGATQDGLGGGKHQANRRFQDAANSGVVAAV
jgi:acyl dehydratase